MRAHLAKLIARTISSRKIVACVVEAHKVKEMAKRTRKEQNHHHHHHLIASTRSWRVVRGLEIRARVMAPRTVLTSRLRIFAVRRASEAMDCDLVSGIWHSH